MRSAEVDPLTAWILDRGVERGTWNHVEGWIGMPGAGKSVAMVEAARRQLGRCYVLAHDPNENLPRVLPDGSRVPIVRHGDLASLRRSLATSPGGIHAVAGNPDDLVTLAIEVAKMTRRRKGDREFAIPVVVCVDEVVAWEGASRSRVGPVLADLLARRRPHHVALYWGAQYPRMMHYSLMSQATALHLFRVEDRKDLERIEDGGVPEALVAKLPHLPKFQALEYRR
jgi:hypothetical protein